MSLFERRHKNNNISYYDGYTPQVLDATTLRGTFGKVAAAETGATDLNSGQQNVFSGAGTKQNFLDMRSTGATYIGRDGVAYDMGSMSRGQARRLARREARADNNALAFLLALNRLSGISDTGQPNEAKGWNPQTTPTQETAPTTPTQEATLNITFEGWNANDPWLNRILQVYKDNSNNAAWKTMAGDDGKITLDEFKTWQSNNNLVNDGKFGAKSLNALGGTGSYDWMTVPRNNTTPTRQVKTGVESNSATNTGEVKWTPTSGWMPVDHTNVAWNYTGPTNIYNGKTYVNAAEWNKAKSTWQNANKPTLNKPTAPRRANLNLKSGFYDDNDAYRYWIRNVAKTYSPGRLYIYNEKNSDAKLFLQWLNLNYKHTGNEGLIGIFRNKYKRI